MNMNDRDSQGNLKYIAGETCCRPEPSKCYYAPCGRFKKCVKDIPDYDPRKTYETT